MRFKARVLLVCLCTILIAAAASAQTSPYGSREWLADLTAILTTSDQPAVIDDIRLLIEAGNGTLVLHAPPGVILAQLPDAGVSLVASHPNIRKLSKTALNAAAEGITNENALRAVVYFNWVVSGQADATLDTPPDPPGGPQGMPVVLDPAPDLASISSAEVGSDHSQLGTSVLVNLVFVDGGGAPAFSEATKTARANALFLSLSWWKSRIQNHFGVARTVNPSFYTVRQYSYTTSAGNPLDYRQASQWVNSIMNKACTARGDCASWFDANAGSGSSEFVRVQKNVREFNRVTRTEIGMSDAFTAFVMNGQLIINTGIEPNGYAVTLGGSWWATGNVGTETETAATMAHETGHIYWACDEYGGSPHVQSTGCASCDSSRAALNGNADTTGSSCTLSGRRHKACLMDRAADAFKLFNNDHDTEIDKLCWYTRQQVGWLQPACWQDVNWNITTAGTTQWEGMYFTDARIPRFPIVRWAGSPSLVRADGTANGISFNFVTTPLVSACLGTTPRTNDFSVRWRRKINFASGDYEFSGSTGAGDDEVKIYVDGFQLKASTTFPGKYDRIKLNGVHTIQIDYFNGLGTDPLVNVSWVVIPPVSCNPAPNGAILRGRDERFPREVISDFCSYFTDPTPKLLVLVNDGTPPFRVAIQRENQTPVTYEMPNNGGLFPLQPGPTGDSVYKLVSVVDANGCRSSIPPDMTVTVNIDSRAPRLVSSGGPTVDRGSGCSHLLEWKQPLACESGVSIVHTLERDVTSSGNTTTSTLFSCENRTSFIDMDVQAGKTYKYRLTAIAIRAGETCATGAKRSYPVVERQVLNCTASNAAMTTSAVTTSYGTRVTLTARLTGNAVGLSGRTVRFELGGGFIGTATTDASGFATVVAAVTLPVGTHTSGLVARFDGDATWKGTAGAADVTVQATCLPVAITAQPAPRTMPTGGNTTLALTATGSAPVTVKWYRARNDTHLGTGNPLPLTTNVTGLYYAVVSNGCSTEVSQLVQVTVCDAPVIGANPQSATIVAGQSKVLSVTASGSATLFYRWYANGVPITGATTSSITVTPSATTNYHVVIINGCGSATSATATISVCSAAPIITAQPQSVTINQGQSTTLSVTASGVTPAYQWYQGSTAITGATSPTLSVAPTVTTTYKVVITNTCGSVTSNNATVSVCTPPAITSNPSHKQINPGQSATLTAGASGTSLTYQWYLSTGAAITGATSNSITVSPTVTTSYYMKATNSCGTAQTATRTVTVCAAPNITTEPVAKFINAGQSATLTCYASSNTNETYQWYLSNGSAISGATGTSLTVSPTVTTNYYCVVTNSCGSDISRTVPVTVCEPMQILQQPADKTITAGQSATMTAHLYGSSSWSLQWYENGVAMPGRTAAGTTVYPTVTTTYYLRATNPCSSIQTRTVTITVN